jgi:hypothetical protein
VLKKVAEGQLGKMGCETAEQSTGSPAGRLMGKGHFAHRSPAEKPKT